MDLTNILDLDSEEFHCECPLIGNACCKCGKFRCEAPADEAIRHTIVWRQNFQGVDTSADLRAAAILNLSCGESEQGDCCVDEEHAGEPLTPGTTIHWHPANPDVIACAEHLESVIRN